MMKLVIYQTIFLLLLINKEVSTQNNYYFDTIIISSKGIEHGFHLNFYSTDWKEYEYSSLKQMFGKPCNFEKSTYLNDYGSRREKVFIYNYFYDNGAFETSYSAKKGFRKRQKAKLISIDINLNSTNTKIYFDFDRDKKLNNYTFSDVFDIFDFNPEEIKEIKSLFPTQSFNIKKEDIKPKIAIRLETDKTISFEDFLAYTITNFGINFRNGIEFKFYFSDKRKVETYYYNRIKLQKECNF